MKKLIYITMILLIGILVGQAVAATTMSFSLINSVTNTTVKDWSTSGDDYWCEITARAGNGNIVVTLQGTNLTTDSAWVDMVTNKTIQNSTGSSWQFQSLDYYARRTRLHVVSGADIANTFSGKCGRGGR
jgi:hypothetical protein